MERDAEKVVSWKSKGLSAKNLLLLPLQITVFLHQLNGTKIQIFVYYLTEKHNFYSFKHNKFFIVYEQDIWSLLLEGIAYLEMLSWLKMVIQINV